MVIGKTANEPFMVDTLNDLLTIKFNSNIDTMFGFNSMVRIGIFVQFSIFNF